MSETQPPTEASSAWARNPALSATRSGRPTDQSPQRPLQRGERASTWSQVGGADRLSRFRLRRRRALRLLRRGALPGLVAGCLSTQGNQVRPPGGFHDQLFSGLSQPALRPIKTAASSGKHRSVSMSRPPSCDLSSAAACSAARAGLKKYPGWLAAQRVAWLWPAAAGAAGQDPLRQLISFVLLLLLRLTGLEPAGRGPEKTGPWIPEPRRYES